MRTSRFVQVCLVTVAALVGCEAPPPTPLRLPDGLLIEALPAEQRALVRVTLELSGSALPETDLVLADDLTLSGTFELQNASDGRRAATLRVYGRFTEDSEEVLLGRAIDTVDIALGQTTGLDFAGVVFETCDIDVDGACSLEFDRNRNGTTNMLDLAPATVEGGRGIDPAPQAQFIEASPETLQFASGIRLGQFARQVIVLENRGPNPITFDSLEVGGGQGVALSLFDPFGGPVDRPRRSLPADEINTIVNPGDELLVAVSFAPVNAFLTTAGVQVTARDTVTNVVQATRVKVIANADGTLRPRPESYVEPDIGATLEVGSGTIPVSAFPGEELFSGQEITTAGLVRTGAILAVTEGSNAFRMPADRGFVIDVPPESRLAVSLTGLETDLDVAVVGLNAENAVERVITSSRHPENGAEGVDVVNDDKEATRRVVVILGRVELGELPLVPGGLAADEPAPFKLSCELSRGPEFSDGEAIAPNAGPLEGGTPFTLRGRGFQQGAIVSFADFRALDVVITEDPATGESVVTGLMPPGSLEVGKNPATAVVANPSIEAGGDGQAATLPEAFLYDPPAARIDVVLPDVAPTTGLADPITILGSFFTSAEGPPQVNFGDLSVEATFISGGELRVPVAGGPAGTVVVTVQNQIAPGVYGAKSNGVAFRFAEPVGPAPTFTSVDPATGPADGGDTLTITGTGFVEGTRVLFGTAEATVLTVDATSISLRSPAVNFNGPVGISIVNPDGQSTQRPNVFTYFFPPPAIDGVLPGRLPTTGGTLLIVSGQSFREGLVALFHIDGRAVAPLSTVRAGATTVLLTSPPLPVGTATVEIENPDGQTVSSGDIEVFEPQGVGPTIVFVEPASGPLQGRNLITVAGRDFDEDGVRIVLAGTTLDLPVDKGGAAGFDRVQFPAPPALSPGTQPLVLENGDGQSTVASYLYVQVDVARIDQVQPEDLHVLPGNEVQVFGQFFNSFGSELQLLLGAGNDLQTLTLVGRSDGLIIGRVPVRLGTTGLRPVALTDGVNTVTASITVVSPVVTSAEERGDEIEVLGAHFAGSRLQVFCAADEGYRPTIAADDILVVRRDERLDARCPATAASPRPITLVYDSNQTIDPEAIVPDEVDGDGDGVGVRDDPDDANPCAPSIFAGVCDADSDGLVNAVDSADQDACAPSTNAAACGRDTDGDGVIDPVDSADNDPCVPNDQALTCTADSDGDGVTNPFDPRDNDPCAPNPASPTCTLDSDADGIVDSFDPVDDNACIPNLTALNCDADSDGVFPPADVDNSDACVPDTQDPLCGNDDDGDGTINAIDTADTDPCIPNAEALTCSADADGDGVVNPFDPADADPCAPNPASPTCTADDDGDGVINTFDPVDTNPCVPDVTARNCDADNDGVLPPTDTANQDPCVPDTQDPLCNNDDDNDGVINALDSDDANACVPSAFALTCTADDDGDGIVNPFDSASADPCAPNPASPTCTDDTDGDGVIDSFDPVDDNGCIPDTTAAVCDADNDGVLPPTDTANQDPCVPDAQDPLCGNDDDGDGTINALDSNDGDACIPNAEALTCAADADGDGVVNPFDPADADPCSPNPASPTCTADDDADGVTNTFDPADGNACVPNVNAANCDADGDGVLPPTDTANQDPCVPDDQDPLCTDDDDRDGTRNAADPDDGDACIPDAEALACTADADNDGVANPFDAADADPCTPNPAAAACVADADNDGVTDPFDPNDGNACVPDTDAVTCDADSDGVLPPLDADNTDPCVPDGADPLCGNDDDGDGVINAVDVGPTDPCAPSREALVCGADDDNDGVVNPFDAADADPCTPNPAASSCSADTDGDGVTNPFDPVDDNACVPNVNAVNCDADGDGVLPPADTANQDPCVPDAQDPLCTDDADRDGTRNAADPDDANPCIPDSESLTCGADADGDGIANPFDPADADGCNPNPSSTACTADADDDGVSDPLDPADADPCVPRNTATTCDLDGDLIFPPTDTNNSDACTPNRNAGTCGADDDRDGVLNPADSDDADACVPDRNALTCGADDDNDGVANPFDANDGNACVPNTTSPACVQAPTISLVSPAAIHATVQGDSLALVGTRLNTVTSAVIVQVSNGAQTATTILAATADSLSVRPNAALPDSLVVNSSFVVRVTSPGGVVDSPAFQARAPQVQRTFDFGADGALVLGDFFNPDRIVSARFSDGGTNIVPLTLLSRSDTQLNVAFNGPVVTGVSYQLLVTYQPLTGGSFELALSSPAGFAFKRVEVAGPPAPAPTLPRISVLSSNGCAAFEHATSTGDDRGGIAVTADRVFYNGDANLGAFNTADLAPLGSFAIQDGIFTDFGSGEVVSLFNAGLGRGPTAFEPGFPVTHIATLDQTTGQVTGTLVTLSGGGFTTGSNSFDGLFSGAGAFGYMRNDGSTATWMIIDLTTGQITTIDVTPPPGGFTHAGQCESQWFRGVLESAEAPFSFLFASNFQRIGRYELPSRRLTTISAPSITSLSDMCSITVLPELERWYFHHEGTSQFRSGDETIGFCDLALCGDNVCDAATGENAANCFDDCAPQCGNGVCEANETPGSCGPDCAPTCGDGVCNEAANTCPFDCTGVFGSCGDGFCTESEMVTCRADCPTPVLTSCRALKDAGFNATGTYTIDPDGAGPVPQQQVFCDMTTDGGGYTFQKISRGFAVQDTDAENDCISRGMRLLIPRTQAHLRAAVALARNGAVGPDASDEYAFMLGVYPLFNGATCLFQPMNSGNAACQWDASDGGAYFLHNNSGFGEPNGDNCTTCSMTYFSYDGAGDLISFNDGNHAAATRYICAVNDKP